MLGGRGRREGREESKDGGALAPAELSAFFYAFPVFYKDRHAGAPGHCARTVAFARPPRHFNLNWWGAEGRGRMGQRGRRAKEFIIWLTFLNSEKTNHATQVLDRGPKPQEKI